MELNEKFHYISKLENQSETFEKLLSQTFHTSHTLVLLNYNLSDAVNPAPLTLPSSLKWILPRLVCKPLLNPPLLLTPLLLWLILFLLTASYPTVPLLSRQPRWHLAPVCLTVPPFPSLLRPSFWISCQVLHLTYSCLLNFFWCSALSCFLCVITCSDMFQLFFCYQCMCSVFVG